MMQVYPIRAEKRALIPAVTHVDGSGRLQTVTRESNPRYHALIEAFRVGTMTLAWDGTSGSVLVEARAVTDEEDPEAVEAVEDDDDDEDGPDLLQVRLDAPAARGFIEHAIEVVAAGRPPCPLCGLPLNPEGHICPRRNGYMH
jgi:uncharacterized repeat protein (TIGR03847 family)